jgi:hypothetical protein
VQIADNTDHPELTPDQKMAIAGAASDAAESASGNQPDPVDHR